MTRICSEAHIDSGDVAYDDDDDKDEEEDDCNDDDHSVDTFQLMM